MEDLICASPWAWPGDQRPSGFSQALKGDRHRALLCGKGTDLVTPEDGEIRGRSLEGVPDWRVREVSMFREGQLAFLRHDGRWDSDYALAPGDLTKGAGNKGASPFSSLTLDPVDRVQEEPAYPPFHSALKTQLPCRPSSELLKGEADGIGSCKCR